MIQWKFENDRFWYELNPAKDVNPDWFTPDPERIGGALMLLIDREIYTITKETADYVHEKYKKAKMWDKLKHINDLEPQNIL